MRQKMKACSPTGCQRFHADRPALCGAVCTLLLAVMGIVAMSGCSDDAKRSDVSAHAGIRKPGQVDLQPMNLSRFGRFVDQQRGKVVVVDVWATYCPPCMRDFHHLVELYQLEDRQKVVCMSLNIDNQGLESIDRIVPRVLPFLEKQKATFDNILMTDDADQVYRALGLVGIPAVLIYDQQGRLVEAVTPQDGNSPYKRVKQLIGKLTTTG